MLPTIWKLIDTHADKRSMMRAVGRVWPKGSPEYIKIFAAYDDSFEGHRRQWRHSGERYFRHILAVVTIILLYLKVHDVDLIIAAFLHDLVEDHPNSWTIRRIKDKYGKRVADLVFAVTKPEYKLYGGKTERHVKATKDRVKNGGFLAVILKLSDRLHNMLTLWGSPKNKQAKIKETTLCYLPMAHEHDTLWKEMYLAIAEQIQSSHIDDSGISEVGHKNAA